MKYFPILIALWLLVISCVSVDPFDVAGGDAAFLENRLEQRGKASYLFRFADATTSTGRNSFDTADSDRLSLHGSDITLGVTVRYYPECGLQDLSPGRAVDFDDESAGPVFPGAGSTRFGELRPWITRVQWQDREGIKISVLKGKPTGPKSESSMASFLSASKIAVEPG